MSGLMAARKKLPEPYNKAAREATGKCRRQAGHEKRLACPAPYLLLFAHFFFSAADP
jgi:hypothetical protein